jgi:hypothetical protein
MGFGNNIMLKVETVLYTRLCVTFINYQIYSKCKYRLVLSSCIIDNELITHAMRGIFMVIL